MRGADCADRTGARDHREQDQCDPGCEGAQRTLRPLARYRNSLDTAPTPESVSLGETDVLAGEPLGAQAAINMPNVLGEDTWDMFRVLLR